MSFVSDDGRYIVAAPPALLQFLKARREGASRSELQRLKLAAEIEKRGWREIAGGCT